ncbi:MAG: DUF167 family protein [Chakrabartia sp.]
MTARFWKAVDGGLDIAVRATPKGGRDAVEGVFSDAAGAAWLAVRVSVPADGGRATAAVAALIAHHFGVRPRDVVLASGATSRLKRFRILGEAEGLGRIATQLEGN